MSEVLWYYEEGGRQAGPISHAAMAEAIQGRRLPPGSRVWRAGLAGWQPWEALPELAALAPPPPAGAPPPLSAPPPPLATSAQAPGQGPGWGAPPPGPGGGPPKQRLVYILLALFLGFLGVHNFYAGYTGRAVAQLLISLLVGWLVVPLAAVGIWIIVEIVTVTRDARQVPFT
jgi:TM2 domain-containing membrane protein YozV